MHTSEFKLFLIQLVGSDRDIERLSVFLYSACKILALPSEISHETDLSIFSLFADDEKILVEPACGAALAAVYSDIIKRLQVEGKLAQHLGPVVVVVCGGNNISMEQLQRLKKQLGMI